MDWGKPEILKRISFSSIFFVSYLTQADLRHSAISLLIEMGFSALAIAERVGHESIDITYRYAHLFPTKQTEMADKLDMERMGDLVLVADSDRQVYKSNEFEPKRGKENEDYGEKA